LSSFIGGISSRPGRLASGIVLALAWAAVPITAIIAGEGFEITGGDRTIVSNGIVFERDIYAPIISKTCAAAECHDTETREEGLSLASWDDIAQGSEHGPIFIPGDSENSEIMLRLRAKKKPPMPLKKKALGKDEQTRIADWIDSGVVQFEVTLDGEPIAARWSVVPDSFGVVSAGGLFTPRVESGEGTIVATYKSAIDSVRITVVREAS